MVRNYEREDTRRVYGKRAVRLLRIKPERATEIYNVTKGTWRRKKRSHEGTTGIDKSIEVNN